MGGICLYYNSAVTPFIVAGLRFLSIRNSLLTNNAGLQGTAVPAPTLLIVNRKPNSGRFMSNIPAVVTKIKEQINPIQIHVQIMDELSIIQQLTILGNYSIILSVDGSSFLASILYGKLGTGIILAAREDGHYSNHFHMFPAIQQLFNFHFMHTHTNGWESEANIILNIDNTIEIIQRIIDKHKSSNPFPIGPFSTWHLDSVNDGLYEMQPINSTHKRRINHINFKSVVNFSGNRAWPSSLGMGNLPPYDNPTGCSF